MKPGASSVKSTVDGGRCCGPDCTALLALDDPGDRRRLPLIVAVGEVCDEGCKGMRDVFCGRIGVGWEMDMDGPTDGVLFPTEGDGTGGTGALGDACVRRGSAEDECCLRGTRDDCCAVFDTSGGSIDGCLALDRAELSADFVRCMEPAGVGDADVAGPRLIPDDDPATADTPFCCTVGTRLDPTFGSIPSPISLTPEAAVERLLLDLDKPSVCITGKDGRRLLGDEDGCKTPRPVGPPRQADTSALALALALSAPADADFDLAFAMCERLDDALLGPGIADVALGLGMRVACIPFGDVGGVANGVDVDEVELRREDVAMLLFPARGGDMIL